MADVKINQLPSKTSLADTDVVIVESATQTMKMTVDNLRKSLSETGTTYGSNSNGYYLKMENGTLLMWNTVALAYSSSHIYHASWTFPHALISGTSAIVIGNRSAINLGNTGANGASFTSDTPSTTSVYIRLFDSTNAMTSGLTIEVRVFVIGRWK